MTRKRKLLLAGLLLVTAVLASCFGQTYHSGTNAWDVGIRSGVQSHYYSYQSP